jgi:hypothetical protein
MCSIEETCDRAGNLLSLHALAAKTTLRLIIKKRMAKN